MKKTMVTALCLSMALGSAAMASELEALGVSVNANDESATGYTIDFSYADADATNVQLLGGFQFYESGDVSVYGKGFSLSASDSFTNHLISPQDWQPGMQLRHVQDTGYTMEMEKDEAGNWTASLDLPGGCYMYQYSVSYDNGETWETIADPTNEAESNTWGGSVQTRSKFYVPYDEKQGDDNYYDWSWATPIEDAEAAGTVEFFTYPTTEDGEQFAEVYLPADYDAKREEPYKVLYLAHGGGGNEGDWFHQGNASNILDRLIANGSVEPFVVVCMNNAAFNDMFITPEQPKTSNNADFYRYCVNNLMENLIPYVEENFNVSTETAGKAVAGLSQGAKFSTFSMVDNPGYFSYYGLFSCAVNWIWPEQEDYSEFKNSNIYLAAGFADNYLISAEYHKELDCTVVGFKEKLEAAEIEYNNGGSYVTAEGSHDWFTWQQILKDYIETTLWK